MNTRRKFLSSLAVATAGLVLRFRPDDVNQIINPYFIHHKWKYTISYDKEWLIGRISMPIISKRSE